MAIYEADGLPPAPLAAAAEFHARHIPMIQQAASAADHDCLIVAFPDADHTHHAWRLAAVQMLARAIAPRRINGVSGGSGQAIGAAADYFQHAPGLTGQLISLDDSGAGAVLPSAS
ncbi:MAG: Rossmann fold domain-containing protein [Novosphingobium sp.]|jgi:hypothetical protein